MNIVRSFLEGFLKFLILDFPERMESIWTLKLGRGGGWEKDHIYVNRLKEQKGYIRWHFNHSTPRLLRKM